MSHLDQSELRQRFLDIKAQILAFQPPNQPPPRPNYPYFNDRQPSFPGKPAPNPPIATIPSANSAVHQGAAPLPASAPPAAVPIAEAPALADGVPILLTSPAGAAPSAVHEVDGEARTRRAQNGVKVPFTPMVSDSACVASGTAPVHILVPPSAVPGLPFHTVLEGVTGLSNVISVMCPTSAIPGLSTLAVEAPYSVYHTVFTDVASGMVEVRPGSGAPPRAFPAPPGCAHGMFGAV